MRSLDKNYVTPVLRKHDLIRLNADGFMMTRSLAENYPYSKFYKAALRGGRSQWLTLTDLIETEAFNPLAALKLLIALLLNRRQAFSKMAGRTLTLLSSKRSQITTVGQVTDFMRGFVDSSTYSARLFEISLHSLFQALDELKCLPHFVKPLSQMRSANKKHGNIGDIELVKTSGGLEIIESWDAKFGKPYLRDELEELADKLNDHSETKVAGFVVDGKPNLKNEIKERKAELEELHDVTVHIFSFKQWVEFMASRADQIPMKKVATSWLTAFVESLCQKRRDKAPIDEPCDVWLDGLHRQLEKWSP